MCGFQKKRTVKNKNTFWKSTERLLFYSFSFETQVIPSQRPQSHWNRKQWCGATKKSWNKKTITQQKEKHRRNKEKEVRVPFFFTTQLEKRGVEMIMGHTVENVFLHSLIPPFLTPLRKERKSPELVEKGEWQAKHQNHSFSLLTFLPKHQNQPPPFLPFLYKPLWKCQNGLFQ